MVDIHSLLSTIPPALVYFLAGAVIMVESMGVPLPGEVVLVGASLMASGPEPHVSIHGVAIAAMIGAIIGDSVGYWVGHRFGKRLFNRLSKRFPHHVNAPVIGYAEHVFSKQGMWAVFFGRFIALLRIFAGPLAGSLRMPYSHFLLANALGAMCWAGGTAYGIYFLGQVAEKWMKNFSYVGLIVAIVFGVLASTVMKRRMNAAVEIFAAERGIKKSDPIV